MQGDMRRWPFKVINSNGQTKDSKFTAEETSSLVLLEMKKTAEAHLSEKVANRTNGSCSCPWSKQEDWQLTHTFNVPTILIRSKGFEVKVAGGDTHPGGGGDFDSRL
ncbi:unnamed protein product, partial [Taenia asiatica]|uniref:Ovule protein n=1 Tax=Taenia asiatica TaxID=60517 RepID=A0A0R3VY94_TAEAS